MDLPPVPLNGASFSNGDLLNGAVDAAGETATTVAQAQAISAGKIYCVFLALRSCLM